MKPQLKYAVQLKKITDCPGSAAVSKKCSGFRYCFPKLNDPKNFLPRAHLNPSGRYRGRLVKECCEGYALSMYTSHGALVAKARLALKHSPKFLKYLGDHFVELAISASDGICTPPANGGHFSFFEAVGFDPLKAVKAHAVLAL